MMESNEADSWRARLSEYLDDELDPSERAELETHLDGCAECRTALEQLRRVVTHAARLVDAPPAEDLWPGIAHRIHEGPARAGASATARSRVLRRRALTIGVPQLAAAAVLLVVLSSGVAWQLGRGSLSATGPDKTAAVALSGNTLAVSSIATHRYESAIAQFERVLAEGRDRLDTATVRVVEANLAIIDRAIDEAREALATDPSNAYLNRHLADAMRRKLDLLRRTTSLTQL
ncbi:MAG: anti-sigma factor [Gemmatimonadota bacterium]|nr:zf-HC2 domain-containing protein [Gemmatimonadota bacterium]